MKCHYENVEGVGKVLIPGCMAVAVSQDIDMCTCSPTTIRQFETPTYQKYAQMLISRVRELEAENEYYRKLLESNGVTIKLETILCEK